MTTKIEWCDATINPVVGCSHCSPGCDNCYAERFAARMAKHPNPKISGKYAGVVDENGKWTGNFNVDLTPFASLPKKSKRIFIGSMCDIFHENASYNWFLWIVRRMSQYPQHTFILLTKRPQRMNKFISLTRETDTDCGLWPLPNLWLGVTVCTQAEADEKIPLLLQTPAAVRFVSVEPMLGPVSLDLLQSGSDHIDALDSIFHQSDHWNPDHTGTAMGTKLDWVICGGETGPGARPMHPDSVRSLRDQCQSAGVPFFFKSWGEFSYHRNATCSKDEHVDARKELIVRPNGTVTSGICAYGDDAVIMSRVGKRRAGRLLDGVEHNEFPEGGRAYAN